ncbi:MAG: S-layer homology domain-containing protein [Bacillota bacterium]
MIILDTAVKKLAVALVSLALVSGMFGPATIAATLAAESLQGDTFRFFRDEADVPWAVQYLARASARGLLTGFPGGYFQPNDGVRRAEVVVAVMRLIPEGGMSAGEGGPGGADLPGGGALAGLPDGDAVTRNYPWAADAVNRAINLGVIDVGEPLDPGVLASRVWIAEILVRALGLEEEAQDEVSSILPFVDSGDVPPGKTGYVAVANKWGIMTGNEGLFEPLKNISRAEFAAVLDRSSEITGPVRGLEIRGRLTGVDSKKATVSIRMYESEWWRQVAERGYWDRGELYSGDVTMHVAGDAAIFLDEKEVALSSLKKDHTVSVVWNPQGFARLIDAKSKQRAHWPEIGKVQKEGTLLEARSSGPPLLVFTDPAGKRHAYGLSPSCKVKRDGKTAEVSALEPGDKVKISLNDSLVVSIEAEEQEETLELEGAIKSISLGQRGRISLADDTGQRREFKISPECQVTRAGRPSNLVELRYGDRAGIRLVGDEIVDISVLPRPGITEIEGIVRELRLGPDQEIRIKDAQLDDRVFEMSPYCMARCGGRVIALEDLHVNDRVVLELEGPASGARQTVKSITLRVTEEAGGWVESVEAESAPPLIKVRLYSGSFLYAWALPTARVWRKGKEVEFEDIDAGDRVKMSLVDGVVTSLEVEDSLSAIEGVVEEVDAKRDRLTVRPQDEGLITLTLADSARVTYSKQPVALDEVLPGDRVQIKVKNGLASTVEVEDRVPREVTGQVTRLSTGSSPKIWVKPATGATQNYALAADVNVEYDGLPLKPADILKDDWVSLRIYGSRVTRVVIEKRTSLDVQGTIVSVLADLLEGYSIRIRDEEGDVVTYRVTDDAPIRKGSTTLEWEDLKENDIVGLRLDGNVVTRITILQ